MGCHIERITNLRCIPISTLSGIDLAKVEEAAANNDIAEFWLTKELADTLRQSNCAELKGCVSKEAFVRLTVLPDSSTLLVAHLGSCCR